MDHVNPDAPAGLSVEDREKIDDALNFLDDRSQFGEDTTETLTLKNGTIELTLSYDLGVLKSTLVVSDEYLEHEVATPQRRRSLSTVAKQLAETLQAVTSKAKTTVNRPAIAYYECRPDDNQETEDSTLRFKLRYEVRHPHWDNSKSGYSLQRRTRR